MSRASGADGYTLLELLVVMLIIGLAASMAVALTPDRGSRLRLAADARKVEAMLRSVHDRAMVSDRPVELRLDQSDGAVALTSGEQKLILSDGIAATITPALPPRDGDGGGDGGGDALTFYPDGSASGGVVHLTAGEHSVAVAVDWLTGQTHVQ